jgi:hypothetical protein
MRSAGILGYLRQSLRGCSKAVTALPEAIVRAASGRHEDQFNIPDQIVIASRWRTISLMKFGPQLQRLVFQRVIP